VTRLSNGRRASASAKARAPKLRQLTFLRGGKRRGAGRKPKGVRPLASHATRERLAARHPVLVTTRIRAGLPSLRRADALEVVTAAFAASVRDADRHGMRLIHFTIQTNHVHLIVEARDARSLTRGMQGLLVRMARGLNRSWRRRGSVFADRYDARALRSPREVRNALAYVLNNSKKHGCHFAGLDPFTSGRAFDGWTRRSPVESSHGRSLPILPAKTWLLAHGWRRHGLVDPAVIPGRAARGRRAGASGSAPLDMAALRFAARIFRS
jgi:REP element-mobilizing transposase RayT